MSGAPGVASRRPIPGFPGYSADDHGEVWSLGRVVHKSNGARMTCQTRRLTKHVDPRGYYRVGVAGKDVPVRRLVALAFHGVPPRGCVADHRNRNTLDDRPANLRWTSRSVNAHNSKPLWRHNTSGARGVYRDRDGWRALLIRHGERINLGRFSSIEAARDARKAAEIRLRVVG